MSDTHNHMDNQETKKSDVAVREEAMLEFWKEHDIFNKSLEKDAPNGDFVFYDGPPFATGLPHYGHILASAIKDAIPRFWTMNGYRVERKWGWDCHGLPLENLIEKKLGLATKRDIEEFGVKQFNEAARDAVMEYADEWGRIIPRMGRWADMEDDYKTMDSSYTESVWWVFKSLHEKGLVYEGFKSMHLCPRCGTTLSNFEVNLGYKDIKDISVYVKLKLHPGQKYGPEYETKDSAYLIVWTTTPWTLPGNMAAAVHKDATYVAARVDGELLIVAKDNAERVFAGSEVEMVHDDVKGSDLVGLRYDPPFTYNNDRDLEGKENAWKVYHADYVEIGAEGTGAVHLAPAYGDEDMVLAQEHGVPVTHHVNESGHFMEHITDFAGQLVKPKDDDDAGVTHLDADIEIVKALKENGKLFKKENITHSYPHCWRCDTPLLNYATTSWFVEVTKIKDKLVAENSKVHWVPEHVGTNRFGKWLEGARDWAVSRQRYWGAPLPIWRNPETKEYQVLGSLAELQKHTKKSGNTYLATRHGESEFNVTSTISADSAAKNGLTELGKEQVQTLVAILKKNGGVDVIVTSPLQRCIETADLIKHELATEVVVDERLTEVAVGEFEGKTVDEYQDFYQSGADRLARAPEGGETWNELKQRLGALLFDIEQQCQDKKILFVSHNGPLQMLQAVAGGDSAEVTAKHIDEDTYDVANAELRELNFVPFPHNDNYELDFHRPYIDDFALYEGDTKLERVPDVFDCWFESGSMPYGQHHYPFEHEKEFEKSLFPANFIAEGLDQTRGWFYSLIVLGTALFGKSPYENVIVNGLVLAEDGRKMSKSLQNYPDPMDVADKYGADTMRFYMLSAPIMRAEDLNFSEKGVLELQRKNIGRLHNVLAMYEQYADGTQANATSKHILDRWIVARLNELVTESTAGYKSYELDKATRPVTDFIDDLSIWYLRRSRDRLKGEDKADREAALGTLRYALQQLSLVMAPAMPFYAEYLWSQVKADADPESVHLANWPKEAAADAELLAEMKRAREIVSLALEQRAKAKIKVRQPLQTLTTQEAVPEELVAIVLDEVNVKELQQQPNLPEAVALELTITPELQAEGDVRDLMRHIQDMRKQAGLEPADRITLTIQTSDGGEAIVKQFMDEIQKTVGADSITFGDATGEEVTAGEHSFTIEIAKV